MSAKRKRPAEKSEVRIDVELIPSDAPDRPVLANREALAAASPVFERMLTRGPWTEAEHGKTARVDLSEEPLSTRRGLEIFVAHSNGDALAIRDDDALPVLHLAAKYDVSAVADRALAFLSDRLTAEQAVELASAADQFGTDAWPGSRLFRICMTAIEKDPIVALNPESVDRDSPPDASVVERILSSEWLGRAPEIALVRWLAAVVDAARARSAISDERVAELTRLLRFDRLEKKDVDEARGVLRSQTRSDERSKGPRKRWYAPECGVIVAYGDLECWEVAYFRQNHAAAVPASSVQIMERKTVRKFYQSSDPSERSFPEVPAGARIDYQTRTTTVIPATDLAVYVDSDGFTKIVSVSPWTSATWSVETLDCESWDFKPFDEKPTQSRIHRRAFIEFPSDGKTRVVTDERDGSLRVWVFDREGEWTSERQTESFPNGLPSYGDFQFGGFTQLAAFVGRDGTPYAAASARGLAILIWNLADGTYFRSLVHDQEILSIAVCRDDRDDRIYICCGDWAHNIGVYDFETAERVCVLRGQKSRIMCMDSFVADGRAYLVSGSLDGRVGIWNLSEAACVKIVDRHVERVTDVATFFGADGAPRIASAGDHTVVTMRFDDLETIERSYVFAKKKVLCLATLAAPDGNSYLLAGTSGGKIHMIRT